MSFSVILKVFGGYDVQTKEGFLVPVDHRDVGTFLPLVQQYILPGTTIYSDRWAAYKDLQRLGDNLHTYNFVDPHTGTTTDHIKGMWQKAKQSHNARFGTHRALLDTYLQEFMWRQRFRASSFRHIIEHITRIYPLP